VKKEIFDVYNYWVEVLGIAAYRFDASKHVPDSFRAEFQDNMPVPCFGESWYGNPADLQNHWNAGALWGFQDFPLMHAARDVFARGQSFTRLSWVLQQDGYYPSPNRLVTFIDSHDIARFMNVAQDERKLKLALTFLLTARGVPVIYYGTEQGLAGGADPYNREDMPGWGATAVYLHIQRLCQVRKSYEALMRGNQVELYLDDLVYAFRRIHGGEELITVLNNSGSAQSRTITLPSTSYLVPGTELTNLLNTNDRVTVADDWTIQVSLGAYEGKVYAANVTEEYTPS
jgi:glycosidase